MAYNHLLAEGSPITAPHIEAQYFLPMVDRILEPQTIAHFVGFAFGYALPDGSRAPWIPSLNESESIFFRSEDGTQPPIMTSIMSRIGSAEDGSRLTVVGKNIHSLKSRLWEGIAPFSEEMWEAQGLDLGFEKEGKFEEACEHLSAVVAVFEYLNTAEVQANLRETFNLIYAHWEGLDSKINEKRKESAEKSISLAGLWTIYMENHFKVMTNLAHQWVTRKVDELRAPILTALLEHENPIGIPDAVQWKLTNGLHLLLEVSVRADYTILIPMDGYKGYTQTPLADEMNTREPGLHSPDITERKKYYPQRLKTRSHQIMIEKMLARIDRGENTREQSSGESYYESAMDQVEAQREVRKELRGEDWDKEIRETWISAILKGVEQGGDDEEGKVMEEGFAIYRLTYGQGEDEWSDFVKRLEGDINTWGRGQPGSEEVKPFLKLYWVDGQEVDIAENDIEAAREHFNKNFANDSNDNPKTAPTIDIQQTAFLAIDERSFTYYKSPSRNTTKSLLTIDPSFSPYEGPSRPDESPGFTGTLRIHPLLVWSDLYAQLTSQSVSLEDLWPLAMHHPERVYIGPIIPRYLKDWGANMGMGRVLMQMIRGSIVGMLKGWLGVALVGLGGWWYLRRSGR
ncbi:uncharacterized protein BDV14DRAFT_201297 [Aspergillus stella-maris]|uniref:uncharacterized protein n=1 Tax=Aspergillus stella-maris TaxID=1810926 RepID=UPI003CCDF492